MADTNVRVTSDIGRLHHLLLIRCNRCGHRLLASGEMLAKMFPVPMRLADARFRLRCRACGGRMPELEVIRKPPR